MGALSSTSWDQGLNIYITPHPQQNIAPRQPILHLSHSDLLLQLPASVNTNKTSNGSGLQNGGVVGLEGGGLWGELSIWGLGGVAKRLKIAHCHGGGRKNIDPDPWGCTGNCTEVLLDRSHWTLGKSGYFRGLFNLYWVGHLS